MHMQGKIGDLRELGFADPVKMVTSNPTILGLASDTIRGKIADLRELGFADPVKMIMSRPVILTYSIENVRGKIADLRELGFADPVKMITSFPAMLDLAITNIRGKIADLRELGFADPVKMITSNPVILGYARERLLLCGRIIMRLDDGQTAQMFDWLINKPRALIDAVDAAQTRTWSEVRTIVAAAKNKAKP
jgi:mTERF